MLKKKYLFLVFLLNIFIFFNVNGNSNSTFKKKQMEAPIESIIGVWRFVGHIYHGAVVPPFNDKLVLTFQFFEDGTDILKWYRLDEDGFCERTATYQYDGQNLSQEVIAVNPKNTFECSKDTDMRIGTKSISPFYKKDNKMYLVLPLGDDTLTYIWEPSAITTPVPEPTAIPTPMPVVIAMPTFLPMAIKIENPMFFPKVVPHK
jgi:hypothetical protein